MTPADPRGVALAFVARINAGDVAGIAALLTEDHEFIDIPGHSFRGRETLREGWTGYFRLFPDYQVHVEDVRVAGDTVTLIGRSTGTLLAEGAETLRRPDGTLPPPDELQGPAIWTGRVRDGLIAQWRVYWDTPAVRAALGLDR